MKAKREEADMSKSNFCPSPFNMILIKTYYF